MSNERRTIYLPVFGLATILTILVIYHWAAKGMKASTSILPLAELLLVWGCVLMIARIRR